MQLLQAQKQDRVEFWEELRPPKDQGVTIHIGADNKAKEIQMTVEEQVT